MEHVDNCPLCGNASSGAAPLHARDADELIRCPGCGLVYSNPRYTTGELEQVYREDYYSEADSFDIAEGEANRVLYRAGLSHVLNSYPRLVSEGGPHRVLD